MHMGNQFSVEKPATSECLLDVLYTEYEWNMSILKVSLSVGLSSCRVSRASSKAKSSTNAISPLVLNKEPCKNDISHCSTRIRQQSVLRNLQLKDVVTGKSWRGLNELIFEEHTINTI